MNDLQKKVATTLVKRSNEGQSYLRRACAEYYKYTYKL